MTEKITVWISDAVSDTLFIPLYMCCLETRRQNGLISDLNAHDGDFRHHHA
jgi:O-methyltransferase involved in polyketide biosynthesis